jgi:polysaccharide export outer membrane protein
VYRVSPTGEVDFPLCGKVKVNGMTASDAADAFTACLKNGFVRRPQVSVMVKEFNSKKIFVFGEVTKPGAFPFEEGMTIIHAVSAAGGFTRTASKNSVNITRAVDGKEVKLPVRVEDIVVGREKNFALQPGDIIFVPETFL